MFKNIATYCKESYDELVHKVTWPTVKELTNSAVMVLTASIIIALIVFLMDAKGDPIKSWNFFDAYPVKWSLSDFNAMKNEVVVESISIKYSSFVALEE